MRVLSSDPDGGALPQGRLLAVAGQARAVHSQVTQRSCTWNVRVEQEVKVGGKWGNLADLGKGRLGVIPAALAIILFLSHDFKIKCLGTHRVQEKKKKQVTEAQTRGPLT